MWPAARISKLQFRGILSQVYLQKLLSGGLVKQRPYWLLHIAFFFFPFNYRGMHQIFHLDSAASELEDAFFKLRAEVG